MLETVRRFYGEIWEDHDKSAIPELLAEDFTFRGSLGQEWRGHQGFATYLDFVHEVFAEFACEILETVSEGERVFARMRFSGRHRRELLGVAPSGRRVAWEGAALFRFRDGKIADLWVLGDIQGLLEQLRGPGGER